jgi:hypothetical protein
VEIKVNGGATENTVLRGSLVFDTVPVTPALEHPDLRTLTLGEKRAALRAEHLRLDECRHQLLREFEALRTDYSAEAAAALRAKVIEYQQQLANHAIAREWTYWPPCGRIKQCARFQRDERQRPRCQRPGIFVTTVIACGRRPPKQRTLASAASTSHT